MVKIKMADDSSVFIMPTPSNDFIQGGINFSKRDRTRSGQSLSVLRTFGTQLG